MYQLNDTIIAVSSPASDQRVILRLSGPDTFTIIQKFFDVDFDKDKNHIIQGNISVDALLKINATLYIFASPDSYTGEDIVEIHLYTNERVTELLIQKFLAEGLRTAGPGEFTARSFFNGKIDLAQAEAVNEVIISSNEIQLAAAQKLLAGRLGQTAERIFDMIMNCLELIEAGLDFSYEDIEFITRPQAVEKLQQIKAQLEQLLSGSVHYETVINLPSVGIAGVPNAGKSSLLNKLLGWERSIVAEHKKTTRDVLTGLLTLPHCKCVLFDCAGLLTKPADILDELAQQAAIEALQKSDVVIFCVDISKDLSTDFREDVEIRRLIKTKKLLNVATKVDLIDENLLAVKLKHLNGLFKADFLSVSSKTGVGLEQLLKKVEKKISEGNLFVDTSQNAIALTARHKQAVISAIDNLKQAIEEVQAGNDEIVAMILRAAYREITNIEQHEMDEQILDGIFSRFCIGK